MIKLELSMARKLLSDPDRRFELRIPAFSVSGGEKVAIVGQTGSGKTTAMDILALASPVDLCAQFTLDLGGKQIDLRPMARNRRKAAALRAAHFGYVMQKSPLFPFLSVLENIALQQRISAKANLVFVGELLDRLGIASIASALPGEISQGQKQRTAIARALCHRPSIILCDEPTGALDPDTAWDCLEAIDWAARQSRAALIMITHDWALAERAGYDFCRLKTSRPDPTQLIGELEPRQKQQGRRRS